MSDDITIHQVKTRLVNSYVIEYPDKLLVMDVAVRCHRYVLGFIEQELKRNIRDVQLVICSHDDPDHIGGVFALAEICQAEVAIPKASGAPLQKLYNDPAGSFYRLGSTLREGLRGRSWAMYLSPARNRAARGKPQFSSESAATRRRLQPDSRLQGRHLLPSFDDWQVIHTPGHSWDSCCFYHPASHSLLSGDTLLGSAKLGRLVVPAIYSNARHTRQTLAKLAALDISSVYPGHGSVISGDDVIRRARH